MFENYTKFSVGPVCVAVAAFLVQINFKYMEAVLMKTCFLLSSQKRVSRGEMDTGLWY